MGGGGSVDKIRTRPPVLNRTMPHFGGMECNVQRHVFECLRATNLAAVQSIYFCLLKSKLFHVMLLMLPACIGMGGNPIR